MLANPQLVPTGKNWAVASRALALTLNIPLVIQVLETGGYYAEGDGGGATFMRVAGPVSDGASFQSNDGAYWEIIGPEYNDKQFGTYGDDSHDDTTAIQNALNKLAPGTVLRFGTGPYKITSTINYGDGTDTDLSTFANNCTVIWGGDSSYINALIDSSDPYFGIINAGTHFKWYGAAAGTMFKVNGPIFGSRWIGAIVLDGMVYSGGASGPDHCLQMYSFGNFTIDSIIAVNWQAGGEGILMDTRHVATVGGNANPVVSSLNRIGKVVAVSYYADHSTAFRLDGWKNAGGQDVTITQIGIVQCGISGDNCNAVSIGFIDDVRIDQIVNVTFGTITSSYGLYLSGTATPFIAPARVYIGNAALGQGVGVGGGTNAQVFIEAYELDDAATFSAVTGLTVFRFVDTTNAWKTNLYKPFDGKCKVEVDGNGDGYALYDSSGNLIGSIVREGAGTRITSFSNLELEPASYLVSAKLQGSASYANDAAAAAGGVPVGGLYRNGSVVQIRIT